MRLPCVNRRQNQRANVHTIFMLPNSFGVFFEKIFWGGWGRIGK